MSWVCNTYGERISPFKVLMGKPRERDHSEDPGVDGIILKWIFKKWNVGTWTGLTWFWIRGSGGLV